ncbi:MAG TPA: type I 3-dehydroquinate dehydratase [Clostridia bacterium]|nr:type I 3-dehydroquinate dehydratase [Clostridia bacterium]
MDKKEFAIPKICGAINGQTVKSVEIQFSVAEKTKIDILEWRIDSMAFTYEDFIDKKGKIKDCIKIFKESRKPIILTLRSSLEGGLFVGDTNEYFRILEDMVESFNFSMVDIEYSRWMEWKNRQGGILPLNNTDIIVSHHDFKRMPEKKEILDLFQRMAKLDARFVKGAFMAGDFSETLRLMGAANEFKGKRPEKELIYMAMGEAGMASRILSGEAAPAITYASLDMEKPTAPGQYKLDILVGILELQRRQSKIS